MKSRFPHNTEPAGVPSPLDRHTETESKCRQISFTSRPVLTAALNTRAPSKWVLSLSLTAKALTSARVLLAFTGGLTAKTIVPHLGGPPCGAHSGRGPVYRAATQMDNFVHILFPTPPNRFPRQPFRLPATGRALCSRSPATPV